MVNILDCCESGSLGYGLYEILNGDDNTVENTERELVINSNSGACQTVFLNLIETIVIYNKIAIFEGYNGIKDLLNLENVLSMTVRGGE